MGLLGFIGFTYLTKHLFGRKKHSINDSYSERLSHEIDRELELEDMQEDLSYHKNKTCRKNKVYHHNDKVYHNNNVYCNKDYTNYDTGSGIFDEIDVMRDDLYDFEDKEDSMFF